MVNRQRFAGLLARFDPGLTRGSDFSNQIITEENFHLNRCV